MKIETKNGIINVDLNTVTLNDVIYNKTAATICYGGLL